MSYTPLSTHDLRIAGTYRVAYLYMSYKKLVKLLGKPNSTGDEYKVSTEWDLINAYTEEVITIHDWKATHLYHGNLPSVKAFRAKRSYEWSVGSHNKASAEHFLKWLEDKSDDYERELARARKRKQRRAK